jgi:uncharacterized protein (DUF58 family)
MKTGRLVPSYFSIIGFGLAQILAACLLVLALLHHQSALTVITLLALIMVQGARLWALASSRGMRANLGLDRGRVFPGDSVKFELSVENRKALPVLMKTSLPFPARLAANGAPALECGLSAFQRASLTIEIAAAHRGYFEFEKVRVETGDLLGLFRAEQHCPVDARLVVFPRIVPLNPLDFPALEFFGADVVRAPVEDPAFYLGTREYAGDRPARRIHWKASARHDLLQEKLFEPTAQRAVTLVLDAAGYERANAEEPFELMIETAASLAALFESRGAELGFMTNAVSAGGGARVVRPGKGGGTLGRILEAMARLEMRAEHGMAEVMRRATRAASSSVAVYFGLGFDQGARDAWQTLAGALRRPFALVLSDSTQAPRSLSGCRVYRINELRYENAANA